MSDQDRKELALYEGLGLVAGIAEALLGALLIIGVLYVVTAPR